MTRVKHSGDFFTVLTRLSSQVIAFNHTVSFTCVFLNSFLLPQLCSQEDFFFFNQSPGLLKELIFIKLNIDF